MNNHFAVKIINLERELGAMKKQLKEIKKENEQLWKYIKSVERWNRRAESDL